jgi:hypothetical protein
MAEDSFRLGLEIAWRSIEDVNDRYLEEEIKDLLCMLRVRGIERFDLSYRWRTDNEVRLVGLNMIPEACECFSDSIENMPLYINHPKEEVQVVATWRLKCAK